MEKALYEKYKLVEISSNDTEYIKQLYEWQSNENNREQYTCRPVKEIPLYEEYYTFIENHIKKGIKFFVLIKKGQPDILYGKITLFDYNNRNHSAEFGYYLPEKNRGIGIGTIMVGQFIQLIFNLEGRLRDHYWVGNDIQDQLHYSILRKEWK